MIMFYLKHFLSLIFYIFLYKFNNFLPRHMFSTIYDINNIIIELKCFISSIL